MDSAPFTELLAAIVDNRGRTAPTALAGVPLIATNCIKDDLLYPKFEKVRYVDNHTYETWFRGHPEPGDILFVCKGSPGRVALVPEPVSFCIAQDMVAVRADPTKVHPKYLFAALRSRAVRAQIESMHVGSLIPHFKKGDFDKLQIPLPLPSLQEFIGDLYFEMSDKIESNRRLAANIQELVRSLVTRALGEVRLVPVAELASFVNGGAYTKGASGTGRMVVRIAELNSGPGEATVYSDLEVPEDRIARPGDLLMAWSGSLGVYRWTLDEAIINQHIFKVIPADAYPAWLVYDRLASAMPIFRGIAKDKATTMGHIQRGHLESTLVEVPPIADLEDLESTLGPLWNRLLVAEAETVKLAQLRDSLLLELLSGRISVSDLPQTAEVAVA